MLPLLLLASLLCSLGSCARVPEPLTSSIKATKKHRNDRPIIGVLSQPGDPAPENMSYIAASYVKWVESAGARVVPILYDMSEEQVRRRFDVINGLLIPGGGANLTPGHAFYDTSRQLIELAMDANDKGDYFPIQGTCLGMETLSIMLSGNYTILSPYNAEDAAAPLFYTDEARGSHFLKSLPKDVRKNLQDQPIAMENHGKGLSMASMRENKKLDDFFSVISLSLDKSGNPYVSTIEAKEYPFVATQWHPEKNPFEWTPSLSIPHSPEAVRMSQEVANFFISEARSSSHRSHNWAEEDDLLIYNWPVYYTGGKSYDGEESAFEQAYFFPRASSLHDGSSSDRSSNSSSGSSESSSSDGSSSSSSSEESSSEH